MAANISELCTFPVAGGLKFGGKVFCLTWSVIDALAGGESLPRRFWTEAGGGSDSGFGAMFINFLSYKFNLWTYLFDVWHPESFSLLGFPFRG
ncbi:hypothetical protein IV417_04490 [Alphaproteobacteria bacterium KMM 3653]|uniref:Uncharacterized protein n=1 Tax=Harenicola maris TaxID=2841044 RepID=A0AAP2CLH7_9RHOB|nr:hypothetical protein [Harenicola maris]